MSIPPVSARQLKAARALLGWSRARLADESGFPAPRIKAIEKSDTYPAAPREVGEALRKALEVAGVEFLDGASPGVRVRPQMEGLTTDQLNASNDD